jgi:hypothetical protein
MEEDVTRQRIHYIIEHGGLYPSGERRWLCAVIAATCALLSGIAVFTAVSS